MRRTLALLILAAAGLSSCSPIDIAIDYDPKADFSRIRTWAWDPEPPGAAPREHAPPEVDPFTLQRTQDAAAEVLTAKGFLMATPEKADVQIAVHAALERRVTYGLPVVGWGWGWGPGYVWGPYWDGHWGPPSVYVYHESAIFIDLLELKPARRLIWRGVERRRTPEEREDQVRDAVHELFAGFPPKSSN